MSITSKWDINPNMFKSKIELSVKEKTIQIAEKIFESVVAKTPVLTGRARACWKLTEGEPEFISIPFNNHSKTSPIDAPQKPVLVTGNPYPIFNITNGQPYSVKLEYGYSKQAPSGMVRLSLASLSL